MEKTIDDGGILILRYGLNLLYAWCADGEKTEEIQPAIFDKPILDISEKLCGIDIFEKGFRLPKRPLKSVFSDVCIPPDSSPILSEFLTAPLKSNRLVFPDSKSDESWEGEARSIIKNNYHLVKNNPSALLILLEKYGSFIPISESEKYRSISIYEHFKFLSSLTNRGESDKPYLLVSADFSGIQPFIYSISSRGALKSLRARSFFLEFLHHHIVYEILSATGGTPANVIYLGGGGFTLLIGNTKENKSFLRDLKEIINVYFFDVHRARLYLSMQWIELNQDDLLAPKFKEAWLKLGNLLEMDKRNKFKNSLSELLKIEEPNQKTGEDECQICHRDDLVIMDKLVCSGGEEVAVCSYCKTFYRIGDDLTEYKYIIRDLQPSGSSLSIPSLKGGEVFYYRLSKIKEDQRVNWIKNSWDVTEYIQSESYLFLHADHVVKDPAKPSVTTDLDILSSLSTGKKLIGSLRMDVDNLGLVFSEGLVNECFDLPHFSALSRRITLFFTTYMNLLCRSKIENPIDIMGKRASGEPSHRNVSVIYSGGDDLFIVGAWDEVIELACDIASAFQRYGGNNPDISLSGGVVLTKPAFPLYQIANMGKTAEEVAKKELPDCRLTTCSPQFERCPLFHPEQGKRKCARKNAGLLFYVPVRIIKETRPEVTTALRWEKINDEVVPIVRLFRALSRENVITHLDLENISRSFIHKLFSMVDLWEKEGILYLPLMHYFVRKLKEAFPEGVTLPKKHAFAELSSKLLNTEVIKVLWVALTWTDFLLREEGGK